MTFWQSICPACVFLNSLQESEYTLDSFVDALIAGFHSRLAEATSAARAMKGPCSGSPMYQGKEGSGERRLPPEALKLFVSVCGTLESGS